MDITEITDDLIGKKISCKIGGILITDAEITKEGTVYYILQNQQDGDNCRNKKGYKYSWNVTTGENLDNKSIYNLRLLEVIHELWI